VLPPDSRYVSRDELRAQQSQGLEQYFAAAPSKTVWEPPVAPVDQGCADFRAALEKFKELRDSGATPDVMEQTLEQMVGSDGLSFYERMKETLEPVHMGTELWDIAFDSKIEYRVFVSEFLEKRIETEWLSEAFGVTGEILEIAAPMTIAFELWLPTAEAQEEASEHWDAIGQVVAMRQWLRRLIDLTNQAPFPDELHIDIGGADQAVDAWIAEQQAEHPMFDILTHPLETDLVDGYARAAVSFARIGPQVVEQADKYVSEKIAESGLSPCSIKAMTDVGLLDLDQLRRKVIRAFAEAVRDSLPRV
jgi:hypothetical protein